MCIDENGQTIFFLNSHKLQRRLLPFFVTSRKYELVDQKADKILWKIHVSNICVHNSMCASKKDLKVRRFDAKNVRFLAAFYVEDCFLGLIIVTPIHVLTTIKITGFCQKLLLNHVWPIFEF